jgi:hypothetical protein
LPTWCYVEAGSTGISFASEKAHKPITVPAMNFRGAMTSIGISNNHLPNSPSSEIMKAFSQMSQGTNCVIKTFTLSSENDESEYKIKPADTMISNWMTLPTLVIQNMDSKNVRTSFALFVGAKHTPIVGLNAGQETLNY